MPNPKTPVTLATILDQFRDDARSNRDLGDRFERLMCRFFELDPLSLFRSVDVERVAEEGERWRRGH